MYIEFDKHKFHAVKYNNEVFVLIDDVRNFIDKNMYNNTILGNISNIYYDYKSINNHINCYMYSYDNDYYINWDLIIILAMKFNMEKYIKYKHILEKHLNYQEINDNNINFD